MELMDIGTQLTFVWRLVNATESGAIKWISTSPVAFRTRVEPFGYTIESKDGDDYAPFAFKIFKINSPEQEDSPERLSEWESGPFSPLNDALHTLYSTVKRGTLGYDTIVGDMFESLAKVDGGSAIPESSPVPPDESMPF